MGASILLSGLSPNVTAPFGSATPGVSDSSDSPPTPSSIGSYVTTPASSYSCSSTLVITTESLGSFALEVSSSLSLSLESESDTSTNYSSFEMSRKATLFLYAKVSTTLT